MRLDRGLTFEVAQSLLLSFEGRKMLWLQPGPSQGHICRQCALILNLQIRQASQLSVIKRALAREKINDTPQSHLSRRQAVEPESRRISYRPLAPRTASSPNDTIGNASDAFERAGFPQKSSRLSDRENFLAERRTDKSPDKPSRDPSLCTLPTDKRRRLTENEKAILSMQGPDASPRMIISDLHQRARKLSALFEKELPGMLEPNDLPENDKTLLRRNIEEYWMEFFRRRPGRMGAIVALYAKNLDDLKARLRAEPIWSSRDKWVTSKKMSYLGKQSEDGVFPVRRKIMRLLVNTSVQRSMSARYLKHSIWNGKALTIEQYQETWDLKLQKYRAGGDRTSDEVLRIAAEMSVGMGDRTKIPCTNEDVVRFLDTAQGECKTMERLLRARPWLYETDTEIGDKNVAIEVKSKRTSPVIEKPLTPGGTLPLTNAASSFLYGKSAAMTCLLSAHRKVYRAYLTEQFFEDRSDGSLRASLDERKIPVGLMDTPERKEAMHIACRGRPHQGVVLDVSPLPFPPVKAMRAPLLKGKAALQYLVEEQREEEKEINERGRRFHDPKHWGWRKPLVLLLDGIKDEGNMGNIIRTAHFYQADAVAICVNTCAPITSSVVAKAASGALEVVPLLCIKKPTEFLRLSQSFGWKVWASVPPGKDSNDSTRMFSTVTRKETETLGTSNMDSPLADAPGILMLGSEGEGLREIMLARADGRVSIDAPGGEAGRLSLVIDSMNVASAAAVLLEAFMRKPAGLIYKEPGPPARGW
ncbi:hypothetical protein ANO11243_090580 [Dothideomycetidae sp. 11243]|nr:hypothetical protein ANO11243_090580 [fungal sp. No.11243]